jgi:hypothetical protein
MSQTRYPDIKDFTLAVIMTAAPGAEITRQIVEEARSHRALNTPTDTFDVVMEDLNRAHLIDVDNTLTPLADSYARMWRDHFAKQESK